MTKQSAASVSKPLVIMMTKITSFKQLHYIQHYIHPAGTHIDITVLLS